MPPKAPETVQAPIVAEPTAVPAVPQATIATVEAPKPIITFFAPKPVTETEPEPGEKRTAKRKSPNTMLATANIVINPAQYPDLAINDVAIMLGADRDIIVYMPAAGRGFYRHVGPRMVNIEPAERRVDPRTLQPIVSEPSDAGLASFRKLESEVRETWLRACRAAKTSGGEPFGDHVLSL